MGAGSVVAESPWGRARRDLSVVSDMGLSERMSDGGMEQQKYPLLFPLGIPRVYYTYLLHVHGSKERRLLNLS